MKRNILTFVLIIFAGIMSAQMTHNDSVVNRIKVYAIYEISCMQYPQDAKKKKEDLKLKECLEKTPKDFIEKFNTDTKLKKCKETAEKIYQYDVSSIKDSTSLNQFFRVHLEKDFNAQKGSDSFKKLLSFIQKESSKFENLRTKVDELGESSTTPQDDLEEDDSQNEKEMDSIDENINDNIIDQTNESNERHGSNVYNPFEGVNITAALIVLLLLCLSGYCIYLFIKSKKQEEMLHSLSSQCDRIAEILAVSNGTDLSSKVSALVKEKKKLKNEIAGLNSKIEEQERKLIQQQEKIQSPTGIVSGEVYANQEEAYSQMPKELIGTEMFLGLPTNNLFGNPYESYKPGKTLYKLTYTSDSSATYEFYNSPETIQYAKQSRSKFIECACMIDNEDVDYFSTIATIQKGKLEKTDEGWKIITKARVHLA